MWQRNYYEHIIRNENSLDKIRDYIVNNPFKWDSDELNPENTNTAKGGISKMDESVYVSSLNNGLEK